MNIKPSLYAILVITIFLIGSIILKEKTVPPLTLEEEIDAAIIEYAPNLADYPHATTIDGQSGEYVRFSVSPNPGVELDPGFGFAQKQNNKWVILNLGTGGDPTEFYQQYSIPKELQDSAFAQ